ncbi:MAG: hypothetical protein ACI83W_001849 [Marinoscillum sp.]|jgi:hypothetical protein
MVGFLEEQMYTNVTNTSLPTFKKLLDSLLYKANKHGDTEVNEIMEGSYELLRILDLGL